MPLIDQHAADLHLLAGLACLVASLVMLGAARTGAGRAAIRTVEAAMEVAAGAGFDRDLDLERLFRDVQGARYHPVRGSGQLAYTGRVALGLDVNDVREGGKEPKT